MRNSHELEPMIRVDATFLARVLMLIAAILTLIAVAMAVFDRSASNGLVGELVSSVHRLFNPDLEANASTWFVTVLLLSGAALLGLVARAKIDLQDPFRWHWLTLSFLILLLSIDEASQIHEMIIKPTQELLGASRDDAWVWTLPALIIVVGFVIVSWHFLKAQPDRIRRLLTLAFAVYIFGAIGVEVIGGAVVGRERPVMFEVMAAIEEFFEMAGAVVLIYTMVGLLGALGARIVFFDRRTPSVPEPSETPHDRVVRSGD